MGLGRLSKQSIQGPHHWVPDVSEQYAHFLPFYRSDQLFVATLSVEYDPKPRPQGGPYLIGCASGSEGPRAQGEECVFAFGALLCASWGGLILPHVASNFDGP